MAEMEPNLHPLTPMEEVEKIHLKIKSQSYVFKTKICSYHNERKVVKKCINNYLVS